MSLKKTGAFVLALAFGVIVAGPVYAADLGGQCCSDLEERIAELEATTARKGNRKVSLTVSGQIDADYTYLSLDGFHDGRISQNGNDQSYLRIAGQAKVNPDLTAGYVLEINIEQLGLLNTPVARDPQPLTRQSFWFVKSNGLGQISIGQQAAATNFFNNPDGFSTNNAWLAGKPLSLGSLSDLYLTGIDVPLDGGYQSSVKYVSPELYGMTLSATWSDSVDNKSSTGSGNDYDVALRYDSKDTIKDFWVKAAAGYRRSTDFDVNVLNVINIDLPTGDVDTVTAIASVLNVSTGLFVNGEFANQKWDDFHFTLQGFDVTAGVHEKLNPLGATELFGTWGRISVQPDGSAPDTDIDYYGLGATQAIDAAAMDVYVGWRHYNTDDVLSTNVDAVTAGARIRF